MKRSEAFPSKYVSKDDVAAPVQAVIAGVVREQMPGEEGEEKNVVYFQDNTKPMVLNLVNWMTCEDAFGEDSDTWKGKTVELYKDPNVMFGGKKVGGVRVRIPVGPATVAAHPTHWSENPKLMNPVVVWMEKNKPGLMIDDVLQSLGLAHLSEFTGTPAQLIEAAKGIPSETDDIPF